MKVIRAESIESKPVDAEGAKGVRIRVLIGPADGAPNFVMRRFDVAAGGHTPLHQHAWEHEVYVLSGAGVLAAPGSITSLAAGTAAYVPAGEMHQFRADDAEALAFLCLVPKGSK